MAVSSCLRRQVLNVSSLCPRKDLVRFVCQCLKLNSQVQSTAKNEKETLYYKKKKGMLMDTARILGAGGKGGTGIARTGGIGGNGGDVTIQCKSGASLSQFASLTSRRLLAEHGSPCLRGKIQGKDGKNLNIFVPPGTVIKDGSEVLCDLYQSGETFVLAKGGRGGSFDTTREYNGEKGERRVATLELKLIADIGLVGFPNAGKSTLLGSLSNATPKVADYPFTTLRPTVGQIVYPDNERKVSVTDIPGLIEDAHLNKGMGHKFLRHIERTKALIIVIDVNGFILRFDKPYRTPLECLYLLIRELALYDKTVLSKPTIIALNKVDDDELISKAAEIKNSMVNLQETANITLSDIEIEKLAELCKDEFGNVFTISAKYELGLEPLKEKLLDMVSSCDPTISEDDDELTRYMSKL